MWQRVVNLAEGNGFHTDSYWDSHINYKQRRKEYLKETQGDTPGRSALRFIVCEELFSDPVTLTALTGKTSGVGVGGSAGAGAGFAGGSVSASADEIADPQGNVGLLFNVGFAPFVAGLGAQGGGQVMLSQAKSVNDLPGDGTDISFSDGPIGADGSTAKDGTKTLTVTVGPGAGARYSLGVGGSHSWVPFSMNCGETR